MEAGICEAVVAALNFHGQAFPDLCEKVKIFVALKQAIVLTARIADVAQSCNYICFCC
jgi:hypothetical protein